MQNTIQNDLYIVDMSRREQKPVRASRIGSSALALLFVVSLSALGRGPN